MSERKYDPEDGTGGEGRSEVPEENQNVPGVDDQSVDGRSVVPEESPTGDEGASDE